MGKVSINQIGAINKQLVLDLRQGHPYSSGYLINSPPPQGFKHANGYSYDLSYGVNHTGNKLMDKRVGEKYYCFKNAGIDMAKRIVRIIDHDNPDGQKFYRLIHTSAAPSLSDNSYGQVDEITGVESELAKL